MLPSKKKQARNNTKNIIIILNFASECGALSVALALDITRAGIAYGILTGMEEAISPDEAGRFKNKYENVRGHLYSAIKV